MNLICLVLDHAFEGDEGPYTGTCRRCGVQHFFIHDGSFPVHPPAVAETRRTESAGSSPRAVFSDPLSATRKDAQR